MAQMLSRSSSPAAVPRTIASMVLAATFATSGTSPPPVRRSLRSGTMIRLTRIAAGAPMTEAMTKWAAESGMSGPSSVA